MSQTLKTLIFLSMCFSSIFILQQLGFDHWYITIPILAFESLAFEIVLSKLLGIKTRKDDVFYIGTKKIRSNPMMIILTAVSLLAVTEFSPSKGTDAFVFPLTLCLYLLCMVILKFE